ncbi:hypothetical protein V8G54_014899 [Vigna mungo]|uniref:HVA22-like protein n=1 Tax=Vigna mungo TaxID=3915 RepID=A0AAQ3RZW8_VIGMU
MGTSGDNFLQVLFKNFDVLALYASIKAIESRSSIDDQQWLTYWVLYSLITLFELTFSKVLEVLAIWPYAKLILSCWLVLPQFSGAAHVYRHYVRPFYMNPQMPQMPKFSGASQMWYVPRKNIFSKQDDVLSAAERYMEEHGTEAFERLITKADREARGRRNGSYMIFDDDYIY